MNNGLIRRVLIVLSGLSIAAACQSASTPAATSTISPPAISTDAILPTPLPPTRLNPLSGEPFAEEALIRTPAVLISISHFPAWGRPQAGLSFAPIVYETSITEGASRFLAIFYGGFPAPEIPARGDCEIRWGAFIRKATIIGGRTWLDLDADGLRDIHEGGVGGV